MKLHVPDPMLDGTSLPVNQPPQVLPEATANEPVTKDLLSQAIEAATARKAAAPEAEKIEPKKPADIKPRSAAGWGESVDLNKHSVGGWGGDAGFSSGWSK